MKRIYYLQRIILSVLLLLPLSGCFDSDINRKMLAEMAVNDAQGFAALAELAKSKVA